MESYDACSSRFNFQAEHQRLALRNDPTPGETELSVPAERVIDQTVGYACLTCVEADLVSLDPLNLMTYMRVGRPAPSSGRS